MKIDLNRYKAFFFDFDGVIVDSLDIKTEAFGELFSRYGKEVSRKVMDYHRNNGGVSRYEKFKYYYKNLLHKEIDQRIINKLDKDYSKLVVKKVLAAPYIKGALAFIKRLGHLGKDCFIISGTPQKEIRHILKYKKINKLFKETAGSPDNKTENLRKIMDKYDISPKQAIYFGDAKSDYKAAKKRKIVFIGLVQNKDSELQDLSFKPKLKNFNSLENQLKAIA